MSCHVKKKAILASHIGPFFESKMAERGNAGITLLH